MSEAVAPAPHGLARVAFAAAVGSALEWYDFFLYGTAAALVFNQLFFPKFDPAVGTLAAFASFGVGFAARPFGGLFFGHFGDRWGRQPVLVATLLLVGIGTFLIGCLPGYGAIGWWAPVLLVVLRLIQGFGAGAEYGGAVILAVEYAPAARRGLFGSWAPMGVMVGLFLAQGVFALVSMLPNAQFLAWGWRIPFLLSIVMVAVGLFIRFRIAETPAFVAAQQNRPPSKAPIVDAIRHHPKSFLVVIGSRLAENGLGYLFPVFGLSYIVKTLGMPRGVGLTGVLLGNAAELVGVVFFSWLSDRVGRRPIYMAGALFSAIFAVPFFILVDTKDPWLIRLAFILIMGIGGGAMFGPQAAYFAELFGPRLRYSGFAFARELGSILAGGPAPFLSALLVGWMAGAPWGVAGYVIVLSLITAASVWWGPETVRADIGADALIAEEEGRPPGAARMA
jgi:MHS family shikimate/dehydroshikimate transporter-like MFS transporter